MNEIRLATYPLGGNWYIVTCYVPALAVAHMMIFEVGSSCRACSASARASAARPIYSRASAYQWCAVAYPGRSSIARFNSRSVVPHLLFLFYRAEGVAPHSTPI
jgi:hypothetical protein